MIITIDGPVATGKSTIAKKLAEKLGFIFVDTGAMYRCLTYFLLQQNVDIDDPAQLKHAIDAFSFAIRVLNGEKRYFVGDDDVSEKIRQATVTAHVSKVSALPPVREKLVALQRKAAVGINAVFEGRDLGSVVFPKADLKIFLGGRDEVRAKRRLDELRAKFPQEAANMTLEQMIDDIHKRDTYDSTRTISPLKQAVDAHLIDTSDLTIDQVVETILDILSTKRTTL